MNINNKQSKGKYALIGIVIILVTMGAKLIVDLTIWRKGVQIRHTKEWLIFAPFYAVGVYFLTIHSGFPFLWSLALSSVMGMGSVWVLFDLLFNLLRGQPALSTGSGSGKFTAKSDSCLKRLPVGFQVVLKLIFLIAPIIVYVLSLVNGR